LNIIDNDGNLRFQQKLYKNDSFFHFSGYFLVPGTLKFPFPFPSVSFFQVFQPFYWLFWNQDDDKPFFAVVRCLGCSSGAFTLGGKHLTWLKAALVRCMGRVTPEGKAAN